MAFRAANEPKMRHLSEPPIVGSKPQPHQSIQSFKTVSHADQIDFQALMEVAPEEIVIQQAGKIVYANQATAEQLGAYGSSELIGRDVLSFVAPDCRPIIAARVKKLLAEGGVADLPVHQRRGLDGRITDVEAVAIPIDWGGQPAVLSMVRDITERLQSEQALAETDERFRQLVEALNIGSAIIQNKAIVYTNSAFAQQLGVDEPHDLIGQNFIDFFAPDKRAEVSQRHRKMFATGKALAPRHRQLRRLDGSWVDLETTAVPVCWKGEPAVFGLFHDISEPVATAKALQRTEADFARLIGALPAGIIILQDGLVVYANGAIADQLGATDPADLIGRRWYDFFSVKEQQALAERRRQILDTGKTAPLLDLRMQRLDGRWVDIETTAVRHTWNNKPAILGVVLDITPRLEAEAHQRFLANHDPMTALPNRASFRNHVIQALASADRLGRQVAIHYLDLDNFKDVNDSLGHTVGDQLLQAFAQRVKKGIRKTDVVARLGGDEFAVIQADVQAPDDIVALAQKLLRCTSDSYELNGENLYVSTTIGVAVYPDDGNDFDELLRKADLALYQAKAEGRHAFSFFTEDLSVQVQEREQMRSDIERGLEKDEFEVHFQPIMRRVDGQPSAVEALLRWRHPVKGLLPAKSFIEILESSPNFPMLGEHVLRCACTQGKAWHDAGLTGLRVAVNLSMHQLRQPNLVDLVASMLAETKFDRNCLELELTESAILNIGTSEAAHILTQLSELGIQIALDDFGTGYSSLTFLRQFPVSRIKVDRSFVVGLESSSEDRAIVSGVIYLGRQLEIGITAEGIDNASVCAWLKSEGCDELQGYYLAKPMPADKVSRLFGSTKKCGGAPGDWQGVGGESPPR